MRLEGLFRPVAEDSCSRRVTNGLVVPKQLLGDSCLIVRVQLRSIESSGRFGHLGSLFNLT